MESWEAALVGIVLTAGGAIVARVGWLSARDRLSPQRIAGIRTPSTLANDRTWYAAQRAGAGATLAAGLVGIAAGLVALLLAGARPNAAISTAIGGAVVVLGLAVGGAIRGIRAARATETRPTDDRPGPTPGPP